MTAYHVKILVAREAAHKVHTLPLLLFGCELLVLLVEGTVARIWHWVIRIALVSGKLLDNDRVWALLELWGKPSVLAALQFLRHVTMKCLYSVIRVNLALLPG